MGAHQVKVLMKKSILPPGDRYAYRKAPLRALAFAFDRWAPLFLNRRGPRVRPARFAHIAVIRVDQIGDVVLAAPFVAALRRRYPDARVTLITTPAGQALLKSVPALADVRVFDAPWFSGERGILQGMRDLGVLLRDIAPDAVVDLRGDIRHLWSARRALPNAWIEGYGITGGGFLADHAPDYDRSSHVALRNFAFMDVEKPAALPPAHPGLAALPVNRRASDLLPEPAAGRPWVAFHIGAGADSKRWPETSWKKLAERVSSETDARILWIGDRDADDRSRIVLSLLAPELRARSAVLCHLLGLGELNSLLSRCAVLVTHDSGPAHVAASIQLPTVVLFSGANRPEEWRPLNPRAVILDHPVPCAPCGLRACAQKTHLCMDGIAPDLAFARLQEALS